MDYKIKKFVTLFVSEKKWIVSKGYYLYYYNPKTEKLSYFSRLNDPKYVLLSSFRLTKRLFRAEITHLYHFKNDTWMCIAKKAIFCYNKDSGLFEKCCMIKKGSRPLNMCQSDDGTIYFGEYCFNPDKKEMKIYCSRDNGNSWKIVYTFKEGEINHIHGIFSDPYNGRIWVATGDADSACVFGYTEDGFHTFVKEYSGSQKYRICVPMFKKNAIVFATDTELAQNYIRTIDRITGKVTDGQLLQGSGIYGIQTNAFMAISTTVEPSKVNMDKFAHLWLSKNGVEWVDFLSFPKDKLPSPLFQFGSIRFPEYEGDTKFLVITGRALKEIDGKSVIFPIENIKL